jgi:hypothetical protein
MCSKRCGGNGARTRQQEGEDGVEGNKILVTNNMHGHSRLGNTVL